MRLLRTLCTLALLAGFAPAARAVVTPIDSLNYDTSNGVPLYNRRLVTVQGTVTSPDSLFSTTNTDVFIQDATGGTDVFASGGMASLHFGFGDSVQVSGYVIPYHGGVELDSTLALLSVTHLGTATANPDPVLATCSQVATGVVGNYEPYQGRLVRINGVHLTSGTWPTAKGTVNVQLTMTDATNVPLVLYIYRSSPLNGSPDPGARFDVIGVVKQYTASATPPYAGGYEFVPRFLSDVIPECPGPQFATNPAPVTQDSLSATVSWTTVAPSSGALFYGPTTAYGSNVVDPTVSTAHQVTVTGLTPRTLYHMQASGTDANGTCYSQDRVFITFPSPGTPGDIAVYFNFSVDTTVATYGGPRAQGYVNPASPLTALIDAAHTSVDCAFYSFSLQSVVNSLINAKNRGCTVRLVMDAGNSQNYALQLQAAGINYIISTYAGNHGSAQGGGIMHSKYVVIDAKSSNPNDARVWTGSWNCSVSGQSDCNNSLALHDWGLAQAYTMDFEQMWGGSGAAPTSAAKLGSRKSDIIPHLFSVGGIRIEAYMSPSDQTESHLIQAVRAAQSSELFCILDFTSDSLSHAMKTHRDSLGAGAFAVRGLFEPTQVSVSSEWARLNGDNTVTDYWNPRADVFQDNSTAFDLLHHKYAILDNGQSDAAVWTGSHNWSVAANTVNDENSLLIHDPVIANLYFQEWYARYRESGGPALAAPADLRPASLDLAQSQPNPARGEAVIRFALPADVAHGSLAVYDLSGRRVRTLATGPMTAGPHEARWDGRGPDGTLQPAGVYFYRLEAGDRSLMRKLVLMR